MLLNATERSVSFKGKGPTFGKLDVLYVTKMESFVDMRTIFVINNKLLVIYNFNSDKLVSSLCLSKT